MYSIKLFFYLIQNLDDTISFSVVNIDEKIIDTQVELSTSFLNAINHASDLGEFLASMIFEYLIVSSVLISRILCCCGN